MKTQEIKLMIIENYIDHYTSDDVEREGMKENALMYVEEDYNNEVEDYKLSLTTNTKEINQRLAMIQDDINAIREFIYANDLQDKFHLPTAQCDEAITHLNNIEIACDLDDKESLSWKLFTKPLNK
jgi:hypothetical protein